MSRTSPPAPQLPCNPFQSITSITAKPKRVMLYAEEDILDSVTEWWPHQEDIPMAERGQPKGTRLEVREGAVGTEIAIVPLSMAAAAEADAILDAVVAPKISVPADGPGGSSKQMETMYDENDPGYLADLRRLTPRRHAFIVLKGVVGMEQSTPGASDSEKIDSILATLPANMLRYLSGMIVNFGFGAGDPADFFTKGGSAGTKSSGNSPRQSQKAAKKR